jgi:hypothetical protein
MSDSERRLARIESRIVTLMLHLGLDPNERINEPRQQQQPTKNSFLGKFLPGGR